MIPIGKWAENQTLNLHISVNFCPMKLGLRSFDAEFYADFKNALICREISSRSWDIEIFVQPDKFSINNESEKKIFELTYQAMIQVSSQIVHDASWINSYFSVVDRQRNMNWSRISFCTIRLTNTWNIDLHVFLRINDTC